VRIFKIVGFPLCLALEVGRLVAWVPRIVIPCGCCSSSRVGFVRSKQSVTLDTWGGSSSFK